MNVNVFIRMKILFFNKLVENAIVNDIIESRRITLKSGVGDWISRNILKNSINHSFMMNVVKEGEKR